MPAEPPSVCLRRSAPTPGAARQPSAERKERRLLRVLRGLKAARHDSAARALPLRGFVRAKPLKSCPDTNLFMRWLVVNWQKIKSYTIRQSNILNRRGREGRGDPIQPRMNCDGGTGQR